MLFAKRLGCRTMVFKSMHRTRLWIIGTGIASGLLVVFVTGCTEIQLPDSRVRYIAFGDSATHGTSSNNYPTLLPELLGEPPTAIANEGHGGETSGEGLARLDALLATDFFPDAEVLLYWEGGNDLRDFIAEYDPLLLFSPDGPEYPVPDELSDQLDKTARNLSLGVTAAQDAGLRVFLATYFSLREEVRQCDALLLNIILPSQAPRVNVYIERLNERIRTVAVESGAFLVDIAAHDDVIRAARENYTDCNHLSETGNAIVAEVFVDALTAAKPRSED